VASGYTLWGLPGPDYDDFGVIGKMSLKKKIWFFFGIGPDRVVIHLMGSVWARLWRFRCNRFDIFQKKLFLFFLIGPDRFVIHPIGSAWAGLWRFRSIRVDVFQKENCSFFANWARTSRNTPYRVCLGWIMTISEYSGRCLSKRKLFLFLRIGPDRVVIHLVGSAWNRLWGLQSNWVDRYQK